MMKSTLLLVDGDTQNLRVLEVSLKNAGYEVITADSGEEALDAVKEIEPTLIISDTKLPGMDGYTFCKQLKKNPSCTSIPFIFLTTQRSIEDKIHGLELGVEDYLTKPIFVKEIIIRIQMLLQKRAREQLARDDDKTTFKGNLTDMAVVDLIQTMELGSKSGTIRFINSAGKETLLYFEGGQIVDARMGNLVGDAAIYRLLGWTEGGFQVEFKTVSRERTISGSNQALLMEGMRRVDEWSRLVEDMPSLELSFEVDFSRLAEIPDEMSSLLRELDGSRPLTQVIDDCEVGDLEALTFINKLYQEGLVYESGKGPPAAQPQLVLEEEQDEEPEEPQARPEAAEEPPPPPDDDGDEVELSPDDEPEPGDEADEPPPPPDDDGDEVEVPPDDEPEQAGDQPESERAEQAEETEEAEEPPPPPDDDGDEAEASDEQQPAQDAEPEPAAEDQPEPDPATEEDAVTEAPEPPTVEAEVREEAEEKEEKIQPKAKKKKKKKSRKAKKRTRTQQQAPVVAAEESEEEPAEESAEESAEPDENEELNSWLDEDDSTGPRSENRRGDVIPFPGSTRAVESSGSSGSGTAAEAAADVAADDLINGAARRSARESGLVDPSEASINLRDEEFFNADLDEPVEEEFEEDPELLEDMRQFSARRWKAVGIMAPLLIGMGVAAYFYYQSPYVGDGPAHLRVDRTALARLQEKELAAQAAAKRQATAEREAFASGKKLPATKEAANQTEPGKTEPGKTEPGKTEPAKTEPAKTEPPVLVAKAEPGETEPARTEPGKTEPARTEPGKTEPAKTEPGKTEPAKTEPGKTEPARTEPPVAASGEYQKLLADGLALLKKNKRKAYKVFSRAIKANPAGWEALQQMALYNMERGRMGTAYKHAKKALAANPKAPYAHLVKGAYLDDRGRSGAAKREYRSFLKLCPRCRYAGEIRRTLR